MASPDKTPQHPMIDVPFPLSNGTTAWFRFPKFGWTADDVERFVEFVRASVVVEDVRIG